MRVHSVQQRREPSVLSLDNALDPALMDTSVPAVFPPAVRRFPFNGSTPGEEYEYERHVADSASASHVMFGPRGTGGGGGHVPTISQRLGGYDRRNHYDDNGIEVQLTNGDLALIGNRLCREDSGISINDPHGVAGGGRDGRFERIKKMCSLGTLSSAGSEHSSAPSRTQYWMLMITPVVSSFSLALVIAAVVGPQWLLTEEKIPLAPSHHNTTHGSGTVPSTIASVQNQQLNIQHPHLIPAVKDDPGGVYLTKYTRSSLWMLCSKYTGGTAPAQQPSQQHQPAGGSDFQCASIDYFPSEGYSPDPNDSTNAIPYTVTHSSPFFLASNGVLIVSYGLFLVAMCSTKHKICYFVSGVLFIISGLLMLIGLIMYISILKAEIGSKLRPRSSLQAPQFTFRYGQSFLLYVFGFIITELSGILNVLIYSNVQQEEYDEHLHRHHRDSQSDFPTYQNLSDGIHYDLHYRRDWPPLANEQHHKGVQDGPPIVDYRYPYDGLEGCERTPRYYFERQQEDDADCRLHARSLGRTEGITKSLTDLLYTEPEPPVTSPSVRAPRGTRPNGDGQRANGSVRSPGAQFDAPRWTPGGKLTRSVSTYTDLLPVDAEDEPRGCHGQADKKNRDHSGTTMCGISRQYISRELSKEKLFNEFCKKVGPRPKPKNIYFIDSTDGRNGADSYRSVYVVDPSSPGGSIGRGRTHHRRRNSLAESTRRRTHDHLPCISSYRHRIRSDNSLDVVTDDMEPGDDVRYGRRRDPIGRARSVDYRQTLPRNFQQRHLVASEPEDETGGFGERQALERKRVSASGLLMEPVRLNASHGDLTSDGMASSSAPRWHRSTAKLHQQHHATAKTSNTHCPKYLDPPTYSPTPDGSAHRQQRQHGNSPMATHAHRSFGDLTSQSHFTRPTILSPQVFSPISQPATPTTVRSIFTVVQPQQQHHQQHHQHHRHETQQRQAAEHADSTRQHTIPSPVFDLDRIEQERRKSHSQLFLSSTARTHATISQYDFVNGTAV